MSRVLSASAVMEGVYELLTSSSSFDSSDVTQQDYNLLAAAPGGCAIVLRYRGGTLLDSSFGGPPSRTMSSRVDIEGYIRDRGDPTDMLNRQVQLADEIVNVMHQDHKLGGKVKRAKVDEVVVASDFVLEIGGFQWLPLVVRISGEQF